MNWREFFHRSIVDLFFFFRLSAPLIQISVEPEIKRNALWLCNRWMLFAALSRVVYAIMEQTDGKKKGEKNLQ
jgi:hypothetical protein